MVKFCSTVFFVRLAPLSIVVREWNASVISCHLRKTDVKFQLFCKLLHTNKIPLKTVERSTDRH